MRRRRLYRYSQARKVEIPDPRAQAPGMVHMTSPRIAGPAEFERGVQHGIEMAMRQQGRLAAEVRRSALVAAHSEPFLLMARRGGYDEGFAAGMQVAQRAGAPKDAQFTYLDVEKARRRGFEEGRAASASSSQGGIPNVNEAAIRKKTVDAMLESCRVIAESNPNMDPDSFLKAVRTRSKKIA